MGRAPRESDPGRRARTARPGDGPDARARLVSGGARAVAVTPADALALVRGSALKLDGVSTLVLVDANDLLAGDRDASPRSSPRFRVRRIAS